jgi:hypothetical protein
VPLFPQVALSGLWGVKSMRETAAICTDESAAKQKLNKENDER